MAAGVPTVAMRLCIDDHAVPLENMQLCDDDGNLTATTCFVANKSVMCFLNNALGLPFRSVTVANAGALLDIKIALRDIHPVLNGKKRRVELLFINQSEIMTE